MPRTTLILAAAVALMATPALADSASGQVVAASPAGAAAPPSDTSPAASPAKVTPQAADDDDQGPSPDDKKIHGMVGVGVGTGGYREVYGAATGPLPNGGQASVAIDVGQIGPIHR